MEQVFTLETSEKERLIRCLAKHIRTMRTSCGWSQETLASMIGVTRQTILAVENGKRNMTWTMFLALSFLFLSNQNTRKEFIDSGVYTDALIDFLQIGSIRD